MSILPFETDVEHNGSIKIQMVSGVPVHTGADERRIIYDTVTDKMYIGTASAWEETNGATVGSGETTSRYAAATYTDAEIYAHGSVGDLDVTVAGADVTISTSGGSLSDLISLRLRITVPASHIHLTGFNSGAVSISDYRVPNVQVISEASAEDAAFKLRVGSDVATGDKLDFNGVDIYLLSAATYIIQFNF